MPTPACRLYDEEVVHAIMASTGITLLEYLRGHEEAGEDEVCDFIDANAEAIIAEALEGLEQDGDGGEDEPGTGPAPD
jgi:hypothetical protein